MPEETDSNKKMYVRTVQTPSGATAVQVVYSSRRGSRVIEHIGLAHDEAELEALSLVRSETNSAGSLQPHG
jgi:hypothetical protein